MRTGIALAVLFFFLAFVEGSFLHAFAGSIAMVPLMMIFGMILIQRVGIEEGVAWCMALAFFRGDLTAFFLAVIGPVCLSQIFTTRSVYALLGFGAFAYATASVGSILVGTVLNSVFGVTILSPHPIAHALHEGLLLLPGLLIGVLGIRVIERRILTRFAFRSHDV